ncbi:MAG TPA: ABC transporter permease [Stellaceae bacterium]|nr:ABC transporter permease [Stellaceae bacterium]
MKPDYRRACKDVILGLVKWRIWGRLGWQEIRRRYRRTVLGPLWFTFSLGIFVAGLGLVWAPLFHTNLHDYLPFVTTGMICWTFVASIINEGCLTYTQSESLIKQLNFPLSVLNWMMVWRNIIVLLHNLVIAVVVLLVLQIPPTWATVLFIPGVVIVALNGIWISMLLGMISARFRDVPQLVANLVQVLMFVTPVFWFSGQLGARAALVNYNALYHMINVVRAPLLGQMPTLLNYEVDAAVTILGFAMTLFFYARFRRRIAYWL